MIEFPAGPPPALRAVPAPFDIVARVDVRRALEDPAAAQVVDAALGPLGPLGAVGVPTDMDSARRRIRQWIDLDLEQATVAIPFGAYPAAAVDDREWGVQIEGDWKRAAVVDGIAGEGGKPIEHTRHGRPLYEPADPSAPRWLGVLGDGEYVVGTEAAVGGALATAGGERDPVGGALRDAYAGTRAAPLRFASAVPADRLPEERFVVGGAAVDPRRFVPVEHVAGSAYRAGEAVGFVAELRAGRDSDARDVRNALVGALAGMEETAEDPTLERGLAAVEVERDAGRVAVTFEDLPERAARVVAVLSNRLLAFLLPGMDRP